jgi:small conductance mechanosensitive channel
LAVAATIASILCAAPLAIAQEQDEEQQESGLAEEAEEARVLLHEIEQARERIAELGDSSVNFVVRPWVKTDDYWDVYWDITREVKLRFDSEGLSIPFPQRDVHVYSEQAGVEAAQETRDGTAG